MRSRVLFRLGMFLCSLNLAIVAAAQTTASFAIETPRLERNADGTVTISVPKGLIVCYSLDGSDPDSKAGRYLAPIELSSGGTVKARAFTASRKERSELVVETFPPLPHYKPLPSTLVAVTQNRSWPDYIWEQRHAQILKSIKDKNPRIIFIGDSITHFFNEKLWNEQYGPLRAVNLGYGWDRTENVLWRLTHGEIDGMVPEIAVVMIGTNNLDKNTNSEIAAGIKGICATLHTRLPKTKIVLLGIFPRGAKPSDLRKRIADINSEIKTLDGKENVIYLDFGHQFLEADGSISRAVMEDFLHPSEKGYQIWVDALKPTIDRLMNN